MDRYHVLPLNDLKSHMESGEWCKCDPEVRREDGSVLVVHNAYDGREFWENDDSEAVA